jgi:hypothetical protein
MYSVDSSHTLVSQDGKDGGAGWGLVAARDCAADEALITLPAPLLLSYDERVDAPLRNLIDKVPPQLWAMRLGLRLLTQRAQVSVSVGRRLDAKERERERERVDRVDSHGEAGRYKRFAFQTTRGTQPGDAISAIAG